MKQPWRGVSPARFPSFGSLLARALVAGTVVATTSVSSALAQDRPAVVAEVEGAWVGFPDESIVNETLVGGSVRWYVRPRVSVGPEIAYINGNNHNHLILTGNVTWDLVAPPPDGSRRVTPFLVVGAGLFQTRETFFSDTVTSREGAFTAGGGVRAWLSDRVTVGVDARVGWELHVRIGGSIGVRVGK